MERPEAAKKALAELYGATKFTWEWAEQYGLTRAGLDETKAKALCKRKLTTLLRTESFFVDKLSDAGISKPVATKAYYKIPRASGNTRAPGGEGVPLLVPPAGAAPVNSFGKLPLKDWRPEHVEEWRNSLPEDDRNNWKEFFDNLLPGVKGSTLASYDLPALLLVYPKLGSFAPELYAKLQELKLQPASGPPPAQPSAKSPIVFFTQRDPNVKATEKLEDKTVLNKIPWLQEASINDLCQIGQTSSLNEASLRSIPVSRLLPKLLLRLTAPKRTPIPLDTYRRVFGSLAVWAYAQPLEPLHESADTPPVDACTRWLEPIGLALRRPLPLYLFFLADTAKLYTAIKEAKELANVTDEVPLLEELQEEAWKAQRHPLQEPLGDINLRVFGGHLQGCAGKLAPIPRLTPQAEPGITLLSSNIVDSEDLGLRDVPVIKTGAACLTDRWNRCKEKVAPLINAAKKKMMTARTGDFDHQCLEIELYAHKLILDEKGLKKADSDEAYLAAVLRHFRLLKDVSADPSELEAWWDILLWSVLIDQCFLPIRPVMHLARREAVVASSSALQVVRKADGYCTSPPLDASARIERFFVESARAMDDTHHAEDFRKLSRMQRDSLFNRLMLGVEGEVYGIQTKGPYFYLSCADIVASDAVLVHRLERIEMVPCARRIEDWLDIAHCMLALRCSLQEAALMEKQSKSVALAKTLPTTEMQAVAKKLADMHLGGNTPSPVKPGPQNKAPGGNRTNTDLSDLHGIVFVKTVESTEEAEAELTALVRLKGVPHILPLLDTYVYHSNAARVFVFPFRTPWKLQSWAVSLKRVQSCIVQLLKALQAVHKAGLVHGDIHPGNVLEWEDTIYLADFGLSQQADNARHGTGTTGFIAPELREGAVSSAESDMYALGAVFARLLIAFDATLLPPLPSACDVPEDYATELDLNHPAVSLVASLLSAQPSCRPSADAALGAFVSSALPSQKSSRHPLAERAENFTQGARFPTLAKPVLQ